MSKEELEIVAIVYNRLLESEGEGWGDLDCNLEMFSWLSNAELIEETKIKIITHSSGIFRCAQKHDQVNCFAPRILQAVKAIVSLYEKTEFLDPKNNYILTYYLVMSEMNLIYSDLGNGPSS